MRTIEECKNDLADNLKTIRTSKGLTQQQLSNYSGLARSIISDIERADGNPSMESLFALSHALDVDICELLKGMV